MKKYVLTLLISISTFPLFSQATLYYNGRLFSDNQHATWMTVENGKITGIGSDLPDTTSYASKVNLRDQTVLPGIVDSHIHFIDGGLSLLQPDFAGVNDVASLTKVLNTHDTKLIDGMFIGRNLGHTTFEGVESPRVALDEIMAQTPVILFMANGHGAVANSAGLDKLGFDEHTKIVNGTLPLDKRGRLSGYMFEGASMEASRIVGGLYSSNAIEDAISEIQRKALSYGITTIGDNTFNPWYYKIYQQMQLAGALKIRVRARSFGNIPQTPGLMEGLGHKHLGFIGTGADASRVRHHAIKYFEDMSLSAPDGHFDVVPGGSVYLDREKLREIFALHSKRTMAFHVQGKEGLDNILSVVEDQKANGHRHVIDHAGYASVAQIQKVAALGLSMTIIGGQVFDYRRLAGSYRTAAKFNESELLDSRTKVRISKAALTSDYPYGMDTSFVRFPFVDGLNPFPLMAVNSTGRYPDGSIIEGFENKTTTVTHALEAATANGSFVLGDEMTTGRLAPGFEADFIIVDRPVSDLDPMSLYNTRVLSTYIHGELVYNGNEATFASGTLGKVSNSDYAISPVIGYDPALGPIFGAALFRFPLKMPGNFLDGQLQVLTSGKINVTSSFTSYSVFRNIDLSVTGSYSNFFQYYFGEGNRTDPNNYEKLFANTFRVRPEIAFHKGKSQWQMFTDVRSRYETMAIDKNDNELSSGIPDENTVAAGITFKRDTRDNTFSTRKGMLTQLTVQVMPVSGGHTFTQAFGEIRYFRYIRRPDVVLASHVAAGFTWGTPTYLFAYSLGGAYAVRGNYSNRFRGDKYYLGQLELRFPLYKRLSGVVFGDSGDVTYDRWLKPSASYGGGIRFALTENIKLRLDYGKAKDQSGVFFTFSEAF